MQEMIDIISLLQETEEAIQTKIGDNEEHESCNIAIGLAFDMLNYKLSDVDIVPDGFKIIQCPSCAGLKYVSLDGKTVECDRCNRTGYIVKE